jgi:hypothetical protein
LPWGIASSGKGGECKEREWKGEYGRNIMYTVCKSVETIPEINDG